MYHECAVAVFKNFDRAKEALVALDQTHVPSEQISLVTHDIHREVPEETSLQYGDKAEKNAAMGAGVGGVIGMLLGAPLLAIPGIGPLLIAGPMAAGITGALVGGFLGSMSGWGVHSDRIEMYEQRVRDGAILVVVNGDPAQVAEAKRVLDESHAEEVHIHADSSADSVEA